MECSEPVLKSMQIGKVFPNLTMLPINAMDFTSDGTRLVACDDFTVWVYDVEDAKRVNEVPCKKYGVNLVRCTHANGNVLCASKNSWDETIRYLSLQENRFLRYFSGHRDRVVSIATSPTHDAFLSASADGAIRMWDIRQPLCQAQLQVAGRPAVGFDPSGTVIGIACGHSMVRLFDCRSIHRGPFATFWGHPPRGSDCTHLKFSPDGRSLLLAAQDEYLLLLDAFNGHQKGIISGFENNQGYNLEPSFTADGRHIGCGSEDGSVHIWRVEDQQKVTSWRSQHCGAVGSVLFNPVYLMAATCCSAVHFWSVPPS
eukprot:TRINITY_DN30623_c0_g1_i1.p1 TRINITY_DN30623_c0_g1~~TRINITY_DN30623_c0_g1_i1.p1  ORF type:complete len:335 (-),score=40.99 TRINITY_DN30623_c0_g1_i1:28-969(-)